MCPTCRSSRHSPTPKIVARQTTGLAVPELPVCYEREELGMNSSVKSPNVKCWFICFTRSTMQSKHICGVTLGLGPQFATSMEQARGATYRSGCSGLQVSSHDPLASPATPPRARAERGSRAQARLSTAPTGSAPTQCARPD